MKLFPPRPSQAPRRAFRGKRRYFRKVREEAENYRCDPEEGYWWDYSHYHADSPGWGNRGWRYRREHVRALCTVFQRNADARDRFSDDFQTWILLHTDDDGQDATYLHSRNPNGSLFPLALERVSWGVPELEDFLQPILPGLELRVGAVTTFDKYRDPPAMTTTYFIYALGVGIPLD